ncbi:MAG: hypothetical protein LBL39_00770 [Planctomycetaceae bacterium]|jgi:hypothetical protein|nr:hypothetical protein [Planctomycetaceae bacterium]
MFKKLIERIDSVNDYVNPIVARDVRIEFSSSWLSVVVMIYSCFLIVVCLLVYFLCDLDLLELEINKSVCVINNMTWFIVFLCVCSLSSLYVFSRIINLVEFTDAMFLLTAITPRQYLHAYMLETFIFSSFLTSLFAPAIFVILGQLSNFLAFIAIALCYEVLVAQMYALITLSFLARVKRSAQAGNVSICFVFGWLISFLPLLFFALVWTDYFMWQTIGIFEFISIYILLPIGLLLTGAMGYKLSLYAFKTRGKSLVRMFFLNIFCYTLLSVVMALIYFCIVFVVFNFL